MGSSVERRITRPERAGERHLDQPRSTAAGWAAPRPRAQTRSPSSSNCEHRAPSTKHLAMLAPYPDRLRSSRSTSAQTNANATSTSTPPPPPSHVLSTTSTSQHRLFSSRGGLRMRTNSLSSPSPSPSHHLDSSSTSTDHVPPRPSRNPSRRPALHRRPSTSSGVPDPKHQPLVPLVVTSPSASPIPVSPLSTHHLSLLVHYVPLAFFRFHTHS